MPMQFRGPALNGCHLMNKYFSKQRIYHDRIFQDHNTIRDCYSNVKCKYESWMLHASLFLVCFLSTISLFVYCENANKSSVYTYHYVLFIFLQGMIYKNT